MPQVLNMHEDNSKYRISMQLLLEEQNKGAIQLLIKLEMMLWVQMPNYLKKELLIHKRYHVVEMYLPRV